MGHRADFARKPNLAEHHRVGGRGHARERGNQRARGGEVGGRFVDAQAARDVEIDVLVGERQPRARFQHREHHGEAPGIPPHHRAPGRARLRGRDQGLDFHQHRARAFHAGEHRGARLRVRPALGQKQRRRVRYLGQAFLAHGEDADLVGRTEAVLDRAQDAEAVRPLAFEIEHRVDHVLQHARAGDQAFLGDVADEHQGEAAPLGEPDQLVRRRAHLGDGAGRGLERLDEQRLDRIDHHEFGRVAGGERGGDVADLGRDREPDRGLRDAETFGAEPHLVDRLFARDIDGAVAARRDAGGGLEQQRRFADARIAADQHGGTGHQSAAEHPVELGDAGREARRRGALAAQADEGNGAALVRAAEGLRLRLDRFLGERVPGPARLAAAGPLGRFRAASLADEFRGGARHD